MGDNNKVIPLLGKLPSHWDVVRFRDVLSENTRNGIYKNKKFHGSGTKMVNMGEMFAYDRIGSQEMKRVKLDESELTRFVLQKGDLLFARRSLVAAGAGKCSIIVEHDEPTAFESSIIRARPDTEKTFPEFLFFLFSSVYGKYLMSSILRQVAVSGITGGDLMELKIPLPPLLEQKRIAQILGTLDDKIELNRRMNHTLEAIARAIFKSWFVDFDPVRAKMDGRDTGLPQEIDVLFPDGFEDSELGKIPRGWRVIPLDEVGNFLNGLALQKYPAPEGEDNWPVIKIREMRQGYTKNTNRANLDVPEEYIIQDGDLLFSWSGSLLVKIWTEGPGALNQHLFIVTSKEFPRWFLYFWLLEHLPNFQYIAAGKATTMGHIKRQHLTEALTIIPPKPLLERMAQIIEPYLEMVVSNSIKSRTLAELRDTLLPKLMRGEIGV